MRSGAPEIDKWIPGITATLTWQWRSNQVSGLSLLKTGIFSKTAGDFRRFGLPKRRNGSLETGGQLQKPAVGGPFWHPSGYRHEDRTAWLTIQGSNPHIPDRDRPFEMSGLFRLIPPNFGVETFASHSGNPAFRRPSISSLEFDCPPRAIHADIVKAGSTSSRRAAASRASASRPRWANADARER